MKISPFFYRALLPWALFSQLSVQAAPDAGLLLQQIEGDRKAVPDRPLTSDVAAPQELKSLPGLTLTVQQFRFVGNTLLAEDLLAATTAEYLNRPLSFADLQKAAAAVAERYRQAGWVARSFLPRQEIDGGLVTIQIVEARFGKIQLEGTAPENLPLPMALRYIEDHQNYGELLNADAVNRAVMLLDDLPGLSTTATFHAGDQEGETDLVLKLADTPTLLGSIDLDNYGARSTGSTRISGILYLDSPAHFGEQATLHFLKTEGSQYQRIGLTAPLGTNGLRFGINASQLNYHDIMAESQTLDLHGTADTHGVESSYPIIRSRKANLGLSATYDRKHLDNSTALGNTSNYRIAVATLALSGNLFDQFLGSGISFGNLVAVSGKVDLTGSPNEVADAESTRIAGSYHKWKLSLGRNQALTEELSLYGQFTIQNANRNLDSSERLVLGGYSGVRAYPNGEGTGSAGQTLTLELRQRLAGGFNLAAFYDWGRITAVNVNNTSPNGTALTPLNGYSLSGYGLNLGWIAPMGAELKVTWAHRQGDNPNPTAAGLDQDGSKDLDRFWLFARLTF